MTEKTKTTWKAIAAVVTIIIAAIGAYAALVSAGVIDNPRTTKPETTTESTTTETTAGPTVTQAGASPTGPTTSAKQQLAVGDTTPFGKYDWRVLAVQGDRALLLSKDIIEKRPYDTDYKGVMWENCALRAYLNGDFYEKFSEADRARIILTRNQNPDNTWGTRDGKQFSTSGGNQTDDYVFLLSVPEVLKYFPGLKLDDERSYEADERLVAKFNDTGSLWWLRSPGSTQNDAAYVGFVGHVSLSGSYVINGTGGVRPALWLNLS